MKIVLINNLYEPYARGGAEQVVKTIADGLVEAGHKGVVVSTRPVVKSIKLTPSHDSGSKVHKVESQELATTSNDSNITSYSLLVTRYFFSPWNIISYYHLHKLPSALRLTVQPRGVQTADTARKLLPLRMRNTSDGWTR